MSVQEYGAPRRKTIDVRRLDLRVPAQATDPVILVINRDEQNVWVLLWLNRSRDRNRQRENANH